MAAASGATIEEESVRKAANALLKWRKKMLLQSDTREEEESDDFVYLSITLKKVPPKDLARLPHRIPLRHSLLAQDSSTLNVCLIVDGKGITAEFANKMLKSQGIDVVKHVLKVSKLKSDYKSFDSKKKLYDSFDLFLAAKRVIPILPTVLGKVFYSKKKKIPVPVDLLVDGRNWKEEIDGACKSSVWCLSVGTCSAIRVGRWGITESKHIVENVFDTIDEIVKVVPRKLKGIKCLHMRFSESVALPIFEYPQTLQSREEGEQSGLVQKVGNKRKRESFGKKLITK